MFAGQLTADREMVYTDHSPQRPLVACTLGPVPRRAFVLSWLIQYNGELLYEQESWNYPPTFLFR